jgi:hypothetical protein
MNQETVIAAYQHASLKTVYDLRAIAASGSLHRK